MSHKVSTRVEGVHLLLVHVDNILGDVVRRVDRDYLNAVTVAGLDHSGHLSPQCISLLCTHRRRDLTHLNPNAVSKSNENCDLSTKSTQEEEAEGEGGKHGRMGAYAMEFFSL